MEIYQVGGSVRDELLGLPVSDRDWVVVGASAEELRAKGFRQVGRDFPVFLHPQTGEEYALARTERKTAPGYRGFEVDASSTVTLEEDLARRDLTINALARGPDGELIDPYGGRDDVRARVLRHVSPAFAEDPVRILRAARFAARYAPLGFTIASETAALMGEMVSAGEAAALVPERVWKETEKALLSERPDVFFTALRDCGALAAVFPELDKLFGVPQPPRWHPEIDTGVHVMMVLRMAVRLSDDPRVRFAALVHDLGKGETPAHILPGHAGHEERSVRLVDALIQRLRIPNRYRDLAVAVARYHGHSHRAAELRPATLLKVIEGVGALRRPERLDDFLLACEADARGRKGLQDQAYPQAEILRTAHTAAAAVDAAAIASEDLTGEQIAQRLREARIGAIRRAIG